MAEKIKDLNIVICGVGGQGTLLASRIWATWPFPSGTTSRSPRSTA